MNTADTLYASIDRFAGGQPVGKLESHGIDSLCKRLLAPRDVVEKLLANGVLHSEGPVYQNDDTGRHSFASDNLNEVRRAVLSAITERIVEESDGDPAEVKMAAGSALRSHVDSFEKKPGTKSEFSRFPPGLVRLSRDAQYEEQPGIVQRTTANIGKAALAGGAGLATAAYLRGRFLKPGAGLLSQILTGSAANIATGRSIAGSLSTGATKVASVLRGLMPRP